MSYRVGSYNATQETDSGPLTRMDLQSDSSTASIQKVPDGKMDEFVLAKLGMNCKE